MKPGMLVLLLLVPVPGSEPPILADPSDVHMAAHPAQANVAHRAECNVWYPGNSGGTVTPEGIVCDWKRIPTPVAEQFLDVFFIDAMHGWASHTGNGCIRTTDGGRTWDITAFNDTTFVTAYEGVFFVNPDTGWCVGGATQIRKTTNGGVSWFKQYGPPVLGVNRSVVFIDENIGVVVGSKNYPYEPFGSRTTDGGNSWEELDLSVPGAQEVTDQYWFNADTGWVCGYNALLYTTDGGSSFVDMFPNVPPTGNGFNALLAIQFVSPDVGWIGAANLERHNIYKTTDGGASWTFQDNPVSQNGWNQINDVFFFSPDSGWAAHGTPGTGAIMFTSNGGTDWLMDNTRTSWYDCFSGYESSRFWCGGSNGVVWFRKLPRRMITAIEHGSPAPGTLLQNYPNPFNGVSTFRFAVQGLSVVNLGIYDILGREIATLHGGRTEPGWYTTQWNGAGHPSGIYLYRLHVRDLTGNNGAGWTAAGKLLLVR